MTIKSSHFQRHYTEQGILDVNLSKKDRYLNEFYEKGWVFHGKMPRGHQRESMVNRKPLSTQKEGYNIVLFCYFYGKQNMSIEISMCQLRVEQKVWFRS